MTDENDANYRVTANELRQFIERFERLEAEKKDISDQQKEVMSEAKSRGYDTKVIRKVIALRKRDKDDIAEEEAVRRFNIEAAQAARVRLHSSKPSPKRSRDAEDIVKKALTPTQDSMYARDFSSPAQKKRS